MVLVKVIENLSGHSIDLYKIHGNKSVLLVKNDDQTKMEEGEYFAIETFGSTGRGRVVDSVRRRWTCNYGQAVDHWYGRGMFRTMRRYTMHHPEP
jgi:methionine aminopeptidase